MVDGGGGRCVYGWVKRFRSGIIVSIGFCVVWIGC